MLVVDCNSVMNIKIFRRTTDIALIKSKLETSLKYTIRGQITITLSSIKCLLTVYIIWIPGKLMNTTNENLLKVSLSLKISDL